MVSEKPKKLKTIAIEEHFSTPMFKKNVSANEFRNFYLTSRSEQIGHDIVAELADVGESRIAHMDASGIDVQLLSFGSPGPQAFQGEIAIAMAQDANDRLFEIVKSHPGRFEGFAALATSSPKIAADELERTVQKYGFKGAMIHGHTCGSFLDDQKYWPIFERAEALDVPIYLHPGLPHPDAMKAYFDGYEDLARAAWGFAIDTSCHFLRIVFSGAFDAFPNLRFILGHLGEGLPFAMHRLNDHTYQAAKRRGLKRTPLEYLKENLLVTTSGNWHEPALICTLLTLGAENILFAADWPYEPNSAAMDFLSKLNISDSDKEKIAHLNAERLFRL